MKTNTKRKVTPVKTEEGAPAKRVSTLAQLRRSVMSSLLWEKQFYQDGETIAERIKTLVPGCPPKDIVELAIEAREDYHLRHVPLLLLRELARHPKLKDYPKLLSTALARVCQRADEPAEFLAIYWSEGRCPVSKQVRRGLAWALRKFSEHDLAKYNREGTVSLKDVLFIARPLPKDSEGEARLTEAVAKPKYRRGQTWRHEAGDGALWTKLVEGKLATPDTWEVALSQGGTVEGMDQKAFKKLTFERLIRTGKLGYLALLRNLRNMSQADVDDKLVSNAILARKGADKVLPFRFIAAARAAPQFENSLDIALQMQLETADRLTGKTLVLVDVSGSMDHALSEKSDMSRIDAACGVAMVIREVCDNARVFAFSEKVEEIAPRRGMALRDAITTSMPHGGTRLGAAVTKVSKLPHDRLIVITDEQSEDMVPDPAAKKAYMINVASEKNGVGYGKWTHVDGFSEAVVRFMLELERDSD